MQEETVEVPKVAKEYLEEKRAHILKSAKACFSKKGFHQSTMRDICSKSGLSPGAVYRYFKSKEDIIESIALQALDRNLKLISESGKVNSFQEKMDDLAMSFFRLLEEPEEKYLSVELELWGEAVRNRKVMKILNKSMQAHRKEFARLIAQAQKDGQVDPGQDPETIAMIMISLFQGMIVQLKICGNVELWRYVDTAKFMLRSFLAEPIPEGKR